MSRGWNEGRDMIERMLADRELDLVPPNAELVEEYVSQAKRHLDSARRIDADAVGSFQMAYDSARKALAALLVAQGLRPTSNGGHIAVYEAVMAQFGTGVLRSTIRPFGDMRRLRNSSEYPTIDRPIASDDDAEAARESARAMLELAERLLPELPPFVPDR